MSKKLALAFVLAMLPLSVFGHTTDRKLEHNKVISTLPSTIEKSPVHYRAIALGDLVYAQRQVNWLFIYDYTEQALKVIFSTLMDPEELKGYGSELAHFAGEVRFSDEAGNTIFVIRQDECLPAQIEASQCRFLDLTSDLNAKLQAFPLFRKVQVKESMQNPKVSSP